jgi:hypothetical protein
MNDVAAHRELEVGDRKDYPAETFDSGLTDGLLPALVPHCHAQAACPPAQESPYATAVPIL